MGLEIGQSYSGDDLIEALGGEEKVNERLHAIGNDEVICVLQDEGNDNYKLLAKVNL